MIKLTLCVALVLAVGGTFACQNASAISTEAEEPSGVTRQAINSTPVYADPNANQVIAGLYSLTLDSAITGKLDNIRIVDGVKFTTIAAAVADLGTTPGWVIIPPGAYNVIDTITIANNGQHILGAGKWATQINFNPTSAKPLFAFTKSGVSCTPTSSCRVLSQNSIGGMALYGSGSQEKTAIKAEDASDFTIHDILITGDAAVSNSMMWSGGAASIGIDLRGREATTIQKVLVAADRPINLGLNPNLALCTTLDYCVSNDHVHMQDLGLVAAPGEANIKVASGSVIQNWTIDGTNSFNAGDYGILWNEPQSVAQVSQNISWSNIRWEQQSNSIGYAVSMDRVSTANNVVNLQLSNIAAGAEANGFKLRRTINATMTNCTFGGTSHTAIDADSTNTNLQIINPFFQTGSTVTLSTTASGVSTWQQGSLNVGGDSLDNVKIDGRGAFALAAGAACLATGTGDRFLVWSPGATQDCDAACATVTCASTATCVQGWSMFAGTVNYRYGSECGAADPSMGQGISGKLCCCTGSGCGRPLYK